jgi:hypothetical protein
MAMICAGLSWVFMTGHHAKNRGGKTGHFYTALKGAVAVVSCPEHFIPRLEFAGLEFAGVAGAAGS